MKTGNQNMSAVEDWHLVALARNGDHGAFTELVRRHHKQVIHFCGRMMGSTYDAEDAAQETFIRLHRSLERLTPDHAFTTVLYCMARNATLNLLRTARRHRQRVSAFEKDGSAAQTVPGKPDAHARQQDRRAIIESALTQLAPDLREALVLYTFNNLEYRQIADIQACPIGTVRSRIARAREQLRRHLLRHGDDLL